MSGPGAEVFSSWSDVVARREMEVRYANERLERMEVVDLPLCRIERVSADTRIARLGLKRGKLYLVWHQQHDVARDKHRNVITRARFIKTQLEAAGYRLIPWDFKKGQPPRFWNDGTMEEDEDDFYGSSEPAQPVKEEEQPKTEEDDSSGDEPMDEGDESASDDEGDDSDSDLEIIIDKPATAPKAAQQQQPQESKAIKIEAPPQSSTTTPSQAARAAASQLPTLPGTAYPAIKSSDIDVNGDPIYPPVGKPITQVSMDADLIEESKPWRQPGADQSDYFNYGFDEFSWETYRIKQQTMAETIAEDKREREATIAMMNGMPGVAPAGNAGPPNAPTGPAAASFGMPSESEMMQMMQQMAAQGVDPNNIDFNTMMQMMTNGGGMPGFGGPGGNQGGFGGGGGGQGGGGVSGGRRGGRGRGNW